jgi:hypothetical protein
VDSSAHWYWLRTADFSQTTSFYRIDQYGGSRWRYADLYVGVAPAFRILD